MKAGIAIAMDVFKNAVHNGKNIMIVDDLRNSNKGGSTNLTGLCQKKVTGAIPWLQRVVEEVVQLA